MPKIKRLYTIRAVRLILLLFVVFSLFGPPQVQSAEQTCCATKKVVDRELSGPMQVPDLPPQVIERINADKLKHGQTLASPDNEADKADRYCPYWCDYCDDTYQLLWGSHDYYDYLYPEFEAVTCFSYELYPDTGYITVTIDYIGDWAESWAFVGVCPANDPENWYEYAESCDEYGYNSSVTLSYYVTQTEELLVYVEYYDWGGDYPSIEITHDPLDLNFSVSSITFPSFMEYYVPRSEHPSIGFRISNIGSDNVPPGYEVEAALYATGGVNCDNYSYEWDQDSECLEFYGSNQMDIYLEVYDPYMSYDDVFPVLAVVDPYNMYEESSFQFLNNCDHIADIYWNVTMSGYVEYFDWDDWEGPPFTQWGDKEAVGVPVKAYSGMNTYDETVTDDWGYFELEIPQNASIFYIETELYEQGNYIVYDGLSGYTQAKISEYYLEPDDFEVCLDAFDDYPDAPMDSVYNTGMNAITTLRSVRDFMNDELCNFTSDLITFRVVHELGDDVGGYTKSTRTIKLPSGYPDDLYYNRVIQHELGHMVHHDAVFPGDFTTNQFHHVDWCTDDITAFAEGWAQFFSCVVPDVDEYALMSCHEYPSCHYDNIETNDWESADFCDGNEVEGVTASILYDLYDNSPGEMDPEADNICMPFYYIYIKLETEYVMQTGTMASAYSYLGPDFCALLRNGNYPADVLNSVGCPATAVLEEEDTNILPSEFSLGECYPNPFNSTTKLKFDIPHSGDLDISVINILGRKIYSETLEQISAGSYSYTLDFDDMSGNHLASGIYFLNVRFENQTATRKLNFLK